MLVKPVFFQRAEEFEKQLRLNRLCDCAVRNWGHHAGAASKEVEQSILDFLDNAPS